MTISSRFEPIGQLLEANEYDALPENSRREFVDGVVPGSSDSMIWWDFPCQDTANPTRSPVVSNHRGRVHATLSQSSTEDSGSPNDGEPENRAINSTRERTLSFR